MEAPSPGTAAPERRYKHLAKQEDLSKVAHNEWVLCSALRHRGEVLLLDGVDLNTTTRLIAAGIDPAAIHVPNRSDFDAILRQGHVSHGNLYRSSVQTWAEAHASLRRPVSQIKTVWLDYTCRWGEHVRKTLVSLLRADVMGGGKADVFVTLNADRRCPSAKRLEEVQEEVRIIVTAADGYLDFPAGHNIEYGNGKGMFIVHAELYWALGVTEEREMPQPSPCAANDAPLFEQMQARAHAFRKEANSCRARSPDLKLRPLLAQTKPELASAVAAPRSDVAAEAGYDT